MAKELWELTDTGGFAYDMVGNPGNELAMWLRTSGLLPELQIVGPNSPLGISTAHPKLGSAKLYPHGAAQPGVCIVAKDANAGRVKLYEYSTLASAKNGGGAGGRPSWSSILPQMSSSLAAVAAGASVDVIKGEQKSVFNCNDMVTLCVKGAWHMITYRKVKKKED
jgi:hypothetical protein